ncbi:(2Fe-2S)-binding protein [Streptomyces sp. 796.1]|uniref:(2Fe-2S)-binding protein n=1 Tax=Streptomyces sp. 796.1 TaxID=3163029 RepID=UPI0039C8EA99
MTLALVPACPPDDATAPHGALLLARGYTRLAALLEPLHLDVRWPVKATSAAPSDTPTHLVRREYGSPSTPLRCRPTLEQLALHQELIEEFLAAEAARIAATAAPGNAPCAPVGAPPVASAAPPRHVLAARALHGSLWSLSLLVSGPWYLEGRVPLLTSRAVRYDLAADRYEVTPGGFVCLPGDPAAGLPGVRTVPDAEALRGALRDAFADLVRPLLTAIAPAFRRGPRALWGMAGDDLLSGIWTLGRTLGDEERAVRRATEVLPRAIAPYPAAADFRRLTGRTGTTHLTRTRTGCCLYYAVRPGEACGTCPRTADAERLRRLGD